MVRNGLAAAAALSCLILASSPAGAHGVAIDNAGGWIPQPPPSGGTCNPCEIDLGFKINAGSGGLTNKLFAYNNGLISIGSPFNSLPDFSQGTPVTSTQDFVTPFYDTSDSSVSGQYYSAGYFDYSNMVVATYTPAANDEFVIFPLLQADGSYGENAAAVEFQPAAGSPGAFAITFTLGVSASGSPYLPFDSYDLPDFASGYPIVGYQLGANGADTNYPGPNASPDGQTFNFDYPSSATPEPSTWVELVLGVLTLGVALRRRCAMTAMEA